MRRKLSKFPTIVKSESKFGTPLVKVAACLALCHNNGFIERFHALAPLYYRAADGAIVVFDGTCGSTLQKAHEWVEEVRSYDPNVIVALAANKCDTKLNQRLVESARKYAKEHEFVRTSSSQFRLICL